MRDDLILGQFTPEQLVAFVCVLALILGLTI